MFRYVSAEGRDICIAILLINAKSETFRGLVVDFDARGENVSPRTTTLSEFLAS